MKTDAELLKLNLGCGPHTLAGWFCIDAAQNPNADRPLDMVSEITKIDLPDACASEIIVIHAFEHLHRWECDVAVPEWCRLLVPGGKLALELPDLLKVCRNILAERPEEQLGMWALYGDPRPHDPLMVHKWCWTYRPLRALLRRHGFTDVAEEETKWHPVGRGIRDFRITAVKA